MKLIIIMLFILFIIVKAMPLFIDKKDNNGEQL